jgi:hypothetical protein
MSAASFAATSVLLGLGATWRLTRLRLDERDARLNAGERCIFALWHSRLLPLSFTHRRRGIAVLVSRHRDGEWIARTIERLGYVTARGSSTRGGEDGAREMLRHAEEGRMLGITPDGPRGPAERVKPGLVYLASRTGFPVIPIAAGARQAWRFRSWDAFQVPRPFARVFVAYGDPIHVPSRLDDDAAEAWRERIEAAIRAVTREVDELAGETA